MSKITYDEGFCIMWDMYKGDGTIISRPMCIIRDKDKAKEHVRVGNKKLSKGVPLVKVWMNRVSIY